MESPLSWTPVHYLISEAIKEGNEALEAKLPGPSLVHRIYLKLEDEGYLKMPEKPTETGKT
ncbi:MAG: hypothetical protein G01um101419_188 [Parcubacteria group bacterium Gr01-1014_19]|nr:MAG: hypothetical protein G01um101419_188 [Parcubacteria group bacterium Gr01-1014_19]